MSYLNNKLKSIAKEQTAAFNRSNKKCAICGRPAAHISRITHQCYCSNPNCLQQIQQNIENS